MVSPAVQPVCPTHWIHLQVHNANITLMEQALVAYQLLGSRGRIDLFPRTQGRQRGRVQHWSHSVQYCKAHNPTSTTKPHCYPFTVTSLLITMLSLISVAHKRTKYSYSFHQSSSRVTPYIYSTLQYTSAIHCNNSHWDLADKVPIRVSHSHLSMLAHTDLKSCKVISQWTEQLLANNTISLPGLFPSQHYYSAWWQMTLGMACSSSIPYMV